MGIPNRMVKKMNKNEQVVNDVDEPKNEDVPVLDSNDQSSNISNLFKGIYDRLNTWKLEGVKLQSDVKELHKAVNKIMKEHGKKKKKGSERPKREPSGFAKPTLISKELCAFLQKPVGTEMARTEVTKYLTAYIKTNDLQYPEDKRKTKPDTKLKKLLNLNKDDQVTYFNLQKYMKPHFESAAKSLV